MQQGQVFAFHHGGGGFAPNWAYRYRVAGRGSKRVQRSGFASRLAATQALERALTRLRQEQGAVETPTLSELVETYLAQHDTEPETIAKLRWLLSKSTAAFGNVLISELQPAEIAAWRMTIPRGHRFEATQALRQTLARAVSWGMINTNPAKEGVENPQRHRVEQRPFESWDELHRLAGRLGPQLGPLVLFAAATGLRPSEWLALEHRDIDREQGVVYVRRAYRNGRIKHPKTDGSHRAVPLQAVALHALDALPGQHEELVFPAPRGGYLDLHNFRYRDWKPAQRDLGINPIRRIYDLRHSFATFALRAGISTFDLSRYMGASLTMIDRHYGHLAKDNRQHAIDLLDTFNSADVHAVDARWTRTNRSRPNPSREHQPMRRTNA
jgi:integrase